MTNKVAVVTGGASGIGMETCRLLAANNYDLVVSDLNAETGSELARELNGGNTRTIFVKADVADFQEVKTLIDTTVKEFGKIDLLVNNAGTGGQSYAKCEDYPLEQWDTVIAVNQSGVFYGMKVALAYMREQGFGNIVNVSSLAGVKGSTTGMAYSASKFAVVGMTKSAALEYGKYGIRVNCVCPSFTETPLFDGFVGGSEKMKSKLIKAVPLKRVAEAKEMAETILWLASDKSSYVSGHAMIIDGGASA